MKDHKEYTSEEVAGTEENIEFSTASLPSRKEIHGKKKQKTKMKIKFPFVKLLALFFVILLGTVWAIASLTKDGQSVASSKDKESEYTETIGEISGFEDDEEADVAADENEAASNKDEDGQAREEATEVTEQTEQEKAEEKEETTSETEVTTTETTVNDQQNTQNTQQTTTTQSKRDEVIEHVVKSNENLFRIALKYYSSADGVEIIKQYNGIKGNDIRVGQVLKIPPR